MEEKTIKLENNFIFVPELTSKSVETKSKNEQEIYLDQIKAISAQFGSLAKSMSQIAKGKVNFCFYLSHCHFSSKSIIIGII